MASQEQTARDLTGVGVLADPVRRRLYEYVAGRDDPVRREDAAAAAGISRSLAAYHLDRLAEVGLLGTSYARPEGQTGPGAGRPAKRYQRLQEELSVTIPPRSYALLARLLADAVAADDSGVVRDAVAAAAEHEGRAAAAGGQDLLDALTERGYEPAVTDGGDIELRNCPFHQLARDQTDLVCGVNHALLRGVLSGRSEDPDRAEPAPGEGRCCVLVHPCSRRER